MQSFGTGNQVKLPGPSPDKPNVYDFNVTYDEMYKDLWRKDPDLYPYLLFCDVQFLSCKLSRAQRLIPELIVDCF